MSLKRVIHGVKAGVKHSSPVILTGAAIFGVGATAVLAATGTLGALDDLKAAAEQKGDRLTKREAVKVAAPHYIPAGLSGLATCGAMVLSTKISLGRAAGAAAVATATQTALSEYSDKVAEKFGKEKEQEVRDELAVEKMRANPPREDAVIRTGNGDQLFYFIPHHVWFRSDIEAIRRQLNDFNAELVLTDGKSENELLDVLYHGSDIHGDQFGFPPPSDIRKHSLVELRFTTWQDDSGYPNPEYRSQYILNGEAATAIDYAPWSMPIANWEY